MMWDGKCDGLGCNTACCKGCSCCMERKHLLDQKEIEINELRARVLELMTRKTSISGNEGLRQEKEQLEKDKVKLTSENNRLRGERNNYWQQGKEFYEENEKLKEYIVELEKAVDFLNSKLTTNQEGSKLLKSKTMVLEESAWVLKTQIGVSK